MKIEVDKGVRVNLDRKRSTSAKGGVYDVSKLSDADKKRILSTPGVREHKPGTKKEDSR